MRTVAYRQQCEIFLPHKTYLNGFFYHLGQFVALNFYPRDQLPQDLKHLRSNISIGCPIFKYLDIAEGCQL